MSLYDAFMIGVSGLNASGLAMSIFSSNIANVNTVGYKGSASTFQTMLGAANGGAAGLSAGVMASAQANIAQQGAEFANGVGTLAQQRKAFGGRRKVILGFGGDVE